MKTFKVVLIAVTSVAPFSGPIAALAQGTLSPGYYICESMEGDTSYFSDIFLGPGDADAVGKGFSQMLATKYGYTGRNSCPIAFKNPETLKLLQSQHKPYAAQRAQQGRKIVETGWTYNGAPSLSSATPHEPNVGAPAATAASVPAIHPAVAPAAQPAPPVSTKIVMRLVDTILSTTDPPGKQYRAVVTHATTAGSVSIPVNTEGRITLAQSAGNWSAQLTSLSLNGQIVPVTSSSVSATSPLQQAQQGVQKLGGLLGGLGGHNNRVAAPVSAVANSIAAGPNIVLSAGTALTFTAAVPQSPVGASAGPPAAPAVTAAPPVVASAAGGGNVAAPHTGGGPAGMCEFTAQGKYYYSAIFDVPNGNDRSKWEIAWANYVHDQVDPFPGNSYCRLYPSRGGAQQDLQIHKNQAGAKLIETGWVYTGQEPPPSAPVHSSAPH